MLFCSTRNKEINVPSAHAILNGLADDGGLYIPHTMPKISIEEIGKMGDYDYHKTAETVLKDFLPDYTAEELAEFVKNAYGIQFDTDEVAPLIKVKDNMYSLELWHGPTCAFKDFALQMLPQLLPAAARKCGEDKTVAILVATSGDTGKAALEGFADVNGTKICVFYPHGGTSDIQRYQMVTQTGNNVNVFAVKGNFDDTQNGVKAIFTDAEMADELAENGIMLSSANSINWGRLAPQIVYYYWAYSRLVKNNAIKAGDMVDFCVPTGNFGNILAGYMAKKSGLPINKLVCASNENNVLTKFLETGVYDRNRTFHLTTSPSMDILISSNLERLLFMFTDDKTVKNWMKQLKGNGKYNIGEDILNKLHEEGFIGFCCDDNDTAKTIKRIYNETGYLCDTHTAVGVNAVQQYMSMEKSDIPMVVVSTASPFKFAPAILSALGEENCGDDFEKLAKLENTVNKKAPAPLAELKNKTPRFEKVIDKNDMRIEVLNWLKGR
ncbi:MAG: threonine synthase [Clostridia bacterium]|nr:threonine synthase [Clostridia bacterium]